MKKKLADILYRRLQIIKTTREAISDNLELNKRTLTGTQQEVLLKEAELLGKEDERINSYLDIILA